MTRNSVVYLGLVSALVGCATAPATPPSQTVTTIENRSIRTTEPKVTSVLVKAPSAKVFESVTSIYSGLGIKVTLSDPNNLQVGNRDFTKIRRFAGEPLSTYVDCGMMMLGQAADNYLVTMSIVSQVTPREGGSNVETWMTATARDAATSTGDVPCMSKGTLESKINQLVLQRPVD